MGGLDGENEVFVDDVDAVAGLDVQELFVLFDDDAVNDCWCFVSRAFFVRDF